MAALTIDFARDVDSIARWSDDFYGLENDCKNTLPFSCVEWHMAWCRHFLCRDSRIFDEPTFCRVRDADGVCIAILPFIRTTRSIAGFRVTWLSFLGADPGLTEVRSALVKPGGVHAVASVTDAALRDAGDWDWIEWRGLDDPFDASLRRVRSLDWQRLPSMHILHLPPTWLEFRARLRRNIRESLRHCQNSLRRDGHRYEFTVATRGPELHAALDRLSVLHTLRSCAAFSVEHPDMLSRPGVRPFLHDLGEAFSARDGIRVFEMSIGGRVVAARLGFVVRDGLYLYYSGFDPEWARYSVMTTVVADAIRYAIQHRLATVNLSTGIDPSKTRWGPTEQPCQVAHEPRTRLRSQLFGLAYQRARSGRGIPAWMQQRLPGRRL